MTMYAPVSDCVLHQFCAVLQRTDLQPPLSTLLCMPCQSYTLYIYIYKHETVLSTHIWECKSRSSTWKVNWKILDRGQPFNPVTKTCKLCVRERFYIIRKPHLASLNYRQEIGTFCPHIRMSLLRNIEKVKVPD